MEGEWDELSDADSTLTYMTRTKRPRPSQRITIHQSQKNGYTFANANYYTVCRDHVMLSDLPPWYMVLGPGTITALRTIRALMRIRIPNEADFLSIYKLMRTICLDVTFNEVTEAMVTFFSPPRQEFEEFLLGFALREKDERSGKRFNERQCTFYSAITFFSIENFEKKITNPIPPLTTAAIAPALYWVLNQSVKDTEDVLEAFKRVLLAHKSPYIRSLPNSLISFRRLDQTTRQFQWCDCKGRAIKHDYLHTKHAHRDMPWQAEQEPLLPNPNFIAKQKGFLKYVQRAKERFMIPFTHPRPSLFKRYGRQVDPTDCVDYSQLVRKAKRIYENKLNRDFERCAADYWIKYYKDHTSSICEGRLFEVFKIYHQTQYCPRRREAIKDAYKTTKFKTMPDTYDYAEVYSDPDIHKFFRNHPCYSEFCSLDPHFSHLVEQGVCGDLNQFNISDPKDSSCCTCCLQENIPSASKEIISREEVEK